MTYHLATGGSPVTEGRHYWEVSLTMIDAGRAVFVGAVRPSLDHDRQHHNSAPRCDSALLMDAQRGALFGSRLRGGHPAGRLDSGDRVGVLLDLDAGWMRFYRNGKQHGPGFKKGVLGPLVRAVELYWAGDQVTALPGAATPPCD